MNTQHVKVTFQPGAEPSNQIHDLAWGRQHEAELYEAYGDGFVLVYKQTVVGFGKTIETAVQDAETRFASDSTEITPACIRLFDRNKAALFGIVRRAAAR